MEKSLVYGFFTRRGNYDIVYEIVQKDGFVYLKETSTDIEDIVTYYHKSDTVEECLEKIGEPFNLFFRYVK